MKYLLALCFYLFASIVLNAQSDCPLFNNVSFTKQIQIDSFVHKYPNCKWINNLFITGNDITNLDKFPKDIEISGWIDIQDCANLKSLHYDLNIKNLTGYIKIDNNQKLKTISGFNSILSAGNIFVRNNPVLSDSIFFPNLKTCGNIDINDNPSLSKILGFDSLETAKSIEIYKNKELLTLSGFDNANSITEFKIYGNDKLLKIDALNNYSNYIKLVNIEAKELTYFKGFQNLKNAGTILFSNVNLDKIESFYNVESSSVLLLNCYDLNNLDNFRRLKRAGVINVNDNKNLKSLSGFDSVKIISNQLYIYNNTGLESINGFNQVDSIYGLCNLWENSCSEINGLKKVKYIEQLNITSNHKLTNINGFHNLNKVEALNIVANITMEKMNAFSNLVYCDSIDFRINHAINDLSELGNLDKDYLKKVVITNNDSLAICNVKPICDYMEDSTKLAIVSNNAPGCATREEIIISCQVNGSEDAVEETLGIYPNPVSDKLTVKGKFEKGNIVDVNGQILSSFSSSEIDCHSLKPGIYFVRLFQNESYKTYRFVKI